MGDSESYERRQSVADKADAAHTIASVTSAQLTSHAAEDSRMFSTLTSSITILTAKVDGISKWIWIATGVMLALNRGLDLLIPRH